MYMETRFSGPPSERVCEPPPDGPDRHELPVIPRQIVNHHLMRDLTDMNLWDEDMKNQMISAGGSIQVSLVQFALKAGWLQLIRLSDQLMAEALLTGQTGNTSPVLLPN